MATLSKSKNARLEFRVPSELKTLIEDAAHIQGVSVSDFLAATAYREATQTLQNHKTIELNQSQTARFVDLLLNAPEPNDALRNLMHNADPRHID